MMRAVHGEEALSYSLVDYRFGKLSVQKSLETLKAFLENQRQIQIQIFQSLPADGDDRIQERRRAVKQEEELLRLEQLSCVLLQCREEQLKNQK